MPADVIRRISSKFPADIRSPFFDEEGIPMKPIGVLTVKRQRLYDRKCTDEECKKGNLNNTICLLTTYVKF